MKDLRALKNLTTHDVQPMNTQVMVQESAIQVAVQESTAHRPRLRKAVEIESIRKKLARAADTGHSE